MGVIFDDILGKLREGEDLSQYAEVGSTPQFLHVDDITQLTSAQAESLRIGDTVVAGNGRSYIVAYKGSFMYLVNVMNGCLYDVRYRKAGGQWYYFVEVVTVPTKRIDTDDITALTANQIASLHPGDVVQKNTGTEAHAYVVAYKDETQGECSLVYADAWNVEEVYYEIRNGAWSYVQTDNTAISTLAGKADKVLVATEQPVGGMLPNTVYNLGELDSDTVFSMAAATDNTIASVWIWTFTTGENAINATWPNTIVQWLGGNAPVISGGMYYEITVFNGYAKCDAYELPNS